MRMPLLSAARCMNLSRSASIAAAASEPFLGAAGLNQYSTRQPRRLTIQGRLCLRMTADTPAQRPVAATAYGAEKDEVLLYQVPTTFNLGHL